MQLATESQGCSIISATSNDLVHLPSYILTTDKGANPNDIFWISTGSFPQEIVVQLGAPSSIKSVDIVSLGIRKIQIDKCDGPQANRSTNEEAYDFFLIHFGTIFIWYWSYITCDYPHVCLCLCPWFCLWYPAGKLSVEGKLTTQMGKCRDCRWIFLPEWLPLIWGSGYFLFFICVNI